MVLLSVLVTLTLQVTAPVLLVYLGSAIPWRIHTAPVHVDEALCLKIYAFAYDNDKTAMLTHLKQARRIYKKSISNLSDETSKKRHWRYTRSTKFPNTGKRKFTKLNLVMIRIRIFWTNRKIKQKPLAKQPLIQMGQSAISSISLF